jgi:hypothetical protein
MYALPDDPGSIEKETVAIKIAGKGQKRRSVLFPVRLLCSIDRNVHMDRERRIRVQHPAPSSVFVGRTGKPLKTSAVNRVFSANCRRTGLRIWPHLLRHAYTVERLAYLQDIGAGTGKTTVLQVIHCIAEQVGVQGFTLRTINCHCSRGHQRSHRPLLLASGRPPQPAAAAAAIEKENNQDEKSR